MEKNINQHIIYSKFYYICFHIVLSSNFTIHAARKLQFIKWTLSVETYIFRMAQDFIIYCFCKNEIYFFHLAESYQNMEIILNMKTFNTLPQASLVQVHPCQLHSGLWMTHQLSALHLHWLLLLSLHIKKRGKNIYFIIYDIECSAAYCSEIYKMIILDIYYWKWA